MKKLALLLLAACGHAGHSGPAPGTGVPVAIDLDTDPGLSDLALAPDGALWTESERGRSIYRLTLDGDAVASLDRFDVTNVPDGDDIEAIAMIDADHFALGTETHGVGSASVWFASRNDAAIDARGGFDITGVQIDDNNGIEGICADDQIVVAAIETVIVDGDARYAPVIVQRTDVARDLLAPAIDRVKLTSATGKLSAMSCTLGEQELEILAIERHYDVSRLIAFTLPRFGDATVEATVVRDLTELSAGRNFEGVARLADGRIALIVDDQGATITGPSQLVILPSP
jgi:hypothetical protein